jgi:hypothetical protein
MLRLPLGGAFRLHGDQLLYGEHFGFLVKNISNVSNFAQTAGAGSHSIKAALRGNAVRPTPRAPSSPSLQARGPHSLDGATPDQAYFKMLPRRAAA